MSLIKGDQGMVRTQNRRVVLNHLRAHGPTSRAELAAAIGLSGAAVTQVTGDLLQEGFLIAGPGEGSGVGRRPVPLDINYAGFFAIGVKLMADHLQAVLTDLSTRALGEVTLPIPTSRDPDAVADQVAQAARTLIAGQGVPPQKVIGVGVGMGGVVDAARGVSVRAPRLGWQDVPFAQMVTARTGIPTWIDNDANAFAAAQALFGHGRRVENFVVVIVGQGIGAGLVLSGELYRGSGSGAGEIGHLLSEPDGRPCGCGQRGCLEAYASEEGLLACLTDARPDLAPLTVADLAALAAQGDPGVSALLADGGTRLGRGLSHLVNTLNPELLVIGGEGVRLGDAYFGAMHRELLAHAYPPLARNLRVVTETWGDDVWARGAASLAVRQAFVSAALPGP